MKCVGLYRKKSHLTNRIGNMLFSFLYGIKNKGYDVKICLDSEFCKSTDVDLFVSVGIGGDISCIYHTYKDIPKIVIFDPPIRSKRFFRCRYSYYGISWDGPHRGYYYQDDLPNGRWRNLSKKCKIKIKDWRKKGSCIVIAYQPSVNFEGESRIKYFDHVINKVCMLGKDIIICSRLHSKISRRFKNKWESLGCRFSKGIRNNLKNAYCLVTAGGTTQSLAILEGIPSYCIEPNITDPLKITKRLDIFLKDPPTPDRTNWLNWVAYQQWTLEEMKQGLPYNYLMGIIDKRYYEW